MARSRDEALYREWRDRVSRWKASGLSSEMFAQREGIARPRALVAWSHRLRKLERAPLNGEGNAPVRVVQVPMEVVRAASPAESAASIEVVLRNGARLVVPSDDATLRLVLRALEALT